MMPSFAPQVPQAPPFTPQVQQVRPLPAAPGNTPWQAQPSFGTARGVSAEPVAPAKFVMPTPRALGISANLSVSTAAPAPAPVAVDWNQIQARIERLRVIEYKKERVGADKIRVRLLLPTADPKLGQPVVAEAGTEAAAILLALDHAEAWLAKR